jgi:hypothetical protein
MTIRSDPLTEPRRDRPGTSAYFQAAPPRTDSHLVQQYMGCRVVRVLNETQPGAFALSDSVLEEVALALSHGRILRDRPGAYP